MMWVGQGIAITGIAIAAAWLEINGKPAAGLWLIVGLWAIFGTWHPEEKDDK